MLRDYWFKNTIESKIGLEMPYCRLFILFFSPFFCFSSNVKAGDLTKLPDKELVQVWANSKPEFSDELICREEILKRGKEGDIITGLLNALQEERGEKASQTVALLMDLGAKETAPQLLDLLNKSPNSSIVIALGKFGYEPSVKKIIEYLAKKNNLAPKIAALISLGEIGDPTAIPPVKKELEQPKNLERADYIQANAALALARLGDASGHELARGLLATQARPEVKMTCLEALGVIGDTNDLSLINQVSQSDQAHSDSLVHDYVGVANYLIKTKGMSDEQKIPEISKLLNPTTPWEFEWALREMGKSGSVVFLDKLKEIYEDPKYSQPQFYNFRQSALRELRKNGVNKN